MTDNISIPEARKLLAAYALEWDKPELLDLSRRMVRRKPKYPVARANRKSLDAALAVDIRVFKDLNPTMSNRDIGRKFGVDGGRVSEAIHGSVGL
jgi:hypothetical protein